MAKNGLTNLQMAEELNISKRTFEYWKSKHLEFREAIQKGKDYVDVLVEGSLLRRALGFETVEITKERVFNKETGKSKMIMTKKVVKHVAPDTGACAFWLKNRKSGEWKDRHDHNVTGDILIVPAPKENEG